MGNWQNITLADVAKGFGRYKPFIAVLAGIILVTVFLPGRPSPTQVGTGGIDDVVADSTTESTVQSATDTTVAATADPATGSAPTGTAAGTRTAAPAAGRQAAAAPGTQASGQQAIAVAEGVGPDCDTATGRLKMPTRAAPPCKPVVAAGKNGGATSPGVTDKEITVVWYRAKASPAVQAALTAAGANDDPANVDDTVAKYIDLINSHFNLYGRKIKLHVVQGDVEAEDDAGGKANAISIADTYKPFAVINAVNNAMVDELWVRKIICICTTSQPQEFYEKRFPYSGWTTLMSSTQGYIHRAEYVGKRLARQKAKYAGYRNTPADPMTDEDRVFGLLYYETPDNAYRGGVEFFKRELARYGVELKVALAYPSKLEQAQEQARPLIQRLKDEGVTTVLFSGDPINPATYTTEAARQQWQPEWIITGSALVDTTLFARTYNKDQWSRAFGISYLSLRYPEEQGSAFKLHTWHTGSPPKAGNTYGVLWAPLWIIGTGMHMAGPALTPQTFAKGLFEFPPVGKGGTISPHISYGRHGIWDRDPWNIVDLTAYDDITEIWWDGNAQGRDEVGNDGVGMYRYIDNGKRFLPGEQPNSPPRVFDPANSPTILANIPDNEKPPEYEHKHYYG